MRWNAPSEPGDTKTLHEAALGLDHVSAALREVHALSGMGDDSKFDASMLGQIAAVERGSSLLRQASLVLSSTEPPIEDVSRARANALEEAAKVAGTAEGFARPDYWRGRKDAAAAIRALIPKENER